MTSAKKKPTTLSSTKAAPKSVKYAAKSQSTARATSPAQNAAASWVSGNSEQWQKGASDWAKQSAKLYQLPFAQGDVDAATKKAADTVKSATENMVKMSSDMMQKMFAGQEKTSAASSFDPSAMFKQFQNSMPKMPQMASFDPAAIMKQFQQQMPTMPNFDMGAASEPLNKASQSATRAGAEAMEMSRENIAAITEALNVATTVSKELAADLVSFLNKQFAQNVEMGKQVMTCRTLNDMFDFSNRIVKANLDAFFSQSVTVSQKLFECMNNVSEPLNECAAKSTARMTKAMTA